MGLTVAANLIRSIKEAYPMVEPMRKVLWCDSKVVLAQCSSLNNDLAFVHNRVIKIRHLAKGFEIRHINGKENPADLITKPIKAQKLINDNFWWQGPIWLKDPNIWDKPNQYMLDPPVGNNANTTAKKNCNLGKFMLCQNGSRVK